jgi:hypothetical protein
MTSGADPTLKAEMLVGRRQRCRTTEALPSENWAIKRGPGIVTSAQYARPDSDTCTYGGGGSKGLLLRRCVLVAAGTDAPPL